MTTSASFRPSRLTLADLAPDPSCEGLYGLAAQVVMLTTHPHLDLLLIRDVPPVIVGALPLGADDAHGAWSLAFCAAPLPTEPGASHCAAFVARSAHLTPWDVPLTALVHAGRVWRVPRGPALEALTEATLRHALTVDRTVLDAQGVRARHHSLMRLDAAAARLTLTAETLPVRAWEDVPDLTVAPTGLPAPTPHP